MRTKFLLLLILFSSLKVKSQIWQWTHPESNNDLYADNFAHDVEVDSSGNVYVLSFYRDSLFLGGSFRAKGTGSCLAKYNPAGALLWYRLLTNTNAQQNSAGLIYASDMVVNAQGIFVTGYYATPSTYLCQYNCLTGETTCYQPDYAIGNINFTSQFGELGFFLTRFNTNGTVGWNKLGKSTASNCDLPFVAGLGYPYRPLITSDKSNNITVVFIGGVYNNGTPNSISIGGDIIPLGNYDVSQLVAVKYNASGILQLSAHTNGGGGSGIVDYNSIAADSNGNIFLYGKAYDSTYFGSQLFRTSTPPNGDYVQSTFIAKLSSNGIWQFAKELCNGSNNYLQVGPEYGSPDLLAVDGNNNVYALVNAENFAVILGDSIGNPKYGNNFLVKMTNDGNLIWHKFFGEEVSTYSQSISYSDNNLYLNGRISGYGYPDMVFSDLFIPYSGGNNASEYFVAKADVDGNFKWITAFTADYMTWASGVKAYQDNIYTCGTYSSQLTTLGNLNGAPSNTGNYKIFFGKLKDQYIKVGAVKPTALNAGCTITIPFTSHGLTFSNNNTFTAELSDINGDFTNATIIGSVQSKSSGTITAIIPANLSYGSGYRIRIKSSDTLKTGYNYYAYADTDYKITLLCPPPSTLTNTNITSSSAQLNWRTVDCAKGYRLKYKTNTSTKWLTINITSNTGTYNLTGLTANTLYQWKVASKCKPGNAVYYSKDANTHSFTTGTAGFAADVQASQLKTYGITVYPNPANNNAVILFNTTKAAKYQLELTDISGKVLQTKTGVTINGQNKIVLNMGKYAQGMYVISLTDDEHGTRTLKLNKQ